MGGLFDEFPGPELSQYGAIPVNRTVPAAAVPRLSRQCEEILDRLRRGRRTNAELAGIALKYTGRLSEIRQAGYDVRVVEKDVASGVHVYALFVDGVEVGEP
jgi:hypothetical protein